MKFKNLQPNLRRLWMAQLLVLGLVACSTPISPPWSTTGTTPEPAAVPKPPAGVSPPPQSLPSSPQAPQSPPQPPQGITEPSLPAPSAKPNAMAAESLLKQKPTANKPYTALGARYEPLAADKPYEAKGWASWYGAVHHGQLTASGETYDMNAFTAAHTVLPIPSYARVTNLANGAQAVVRINDRGPFKEKRVMDVSRAAAKHLGFVGEGLAKVSVRLMSTNEALEWLRAGAVQPTATQSGAKALPTNSAKVEAKPQVQPTAQALAPASSADATSEVSRGYYAQFAAYKDNAAAIVLAQRADQAARDLGMSSPLKPQEPLVQLMGTGSSGNAPLSRVLAGPFASRAEAEKAGAALAAPLNSSFIIYQQK